MDRTIFINRNGLAIVSALLLAPVLCWGQIQLSDSNQVPSPDPLHQLSVDTSDPLNELDKISDSKKGSKFFTKLMRSLGLTPSLSSEAGKAYSTEDYDKAVQKYTEAQLDMPESQALAYNLGNAQYKKKKFDEAIKAYQKALMGDNSTLSAQAYYNAGNAYFRKGEFALQQNSQEGIQHFRNAMAHYKKSLEITPDNKNAKTNIEIVQARIKELLQRQKQDQQQQQNQDQQPPPEPSEKAKQALARAMQLVKQRQYAKAKQVLETIIQEDETAISFQSHVQRIDDIMNILAGKPVTKPAPQDPRNQQQGLGVI